MRKAPNRDDMIFLDGRRQKYWKRVADTLALWSELDVIDVACGFGKFSKQFRGLRHYTGVDFSEEMVKMARSENPMHRFLHADAKAWTPEEPVDIIFEVNSLRSLGMTAEDFIIKFRPYARIAVACLEADRFTIENIYPSA